MHTVANVMCAAILLLPSYAFMAPVKYNELAPVTNRSHCTTRYVREHTNRLHEHGADAVTGASGGRTDGNYLRTVLWTGPTATEKLVAARISRLANFVCQT